ncbi:MAG: TonB-dependent receptor [Chitinophagaceae bacterium]|nr:TonB-dependent receptor [Chitinophagaceae bacterium]
MKKKRLPCLAAICISFLFGLISARAQDRTITGTVSDEKGGALSGATVKIKGSDKGVSTDATGHFSLSVPLKASRLEVSYVGYETIEVAARGLEALQISLSPAKGSLNEVVVVGYGTQKRKDVTGSVASVRGSAIKNQPVTSVTEALQGRAAGVEVIKNSGEPGAAPTIIIRGLSSLHQPAPLYIVDGVRMPGDNINIQDIESVDILKDASAAAIYGSAAAGGVILITTKKGRIGKPAVNFNARYGVTKPRLITNLLGKQDYIKLQNIINPNYFKNATQTDTLANTDWVHALYGDAYEQNYNLSVSGATPAVNYLLSGFYNKQKGIYIRNYSNIGGARVNTDYKLGEYIKIGEQLAVSQRKTVPLLGSEAQLHNPPFRTAPIIPLHNKNGTWGTVPPGYGIQFGAPNPVGAVYSADAVDYQNNLQGNAYLEVKLPFHLNFRTNFGYSYYLETQDYFQYPYNFGAVVGTTNSLNKLYNQSSQFLDNFVLTYDQSVGKHNINAVAGYEQITSRYNGLNTTVTANGVTTYSIIPTSNSTTTAGGFMDPNGLIKSYFGRVNYNYDNRYYISGSIRQDANFTVFGPNKQKGTFSAASVGWNVSDEDFFKSLQSIVNVLKLRGSYGQLGNSNIPPYTYTANFGAFTGVDGLGSLNGANFAPGAPLYLGSSVNNLANPNLHWETVTETNIGVDAELLNHKLYFTVEWYNKKTKDMLYALPSALSAGFSAPYFTNIGNVSSKGVDVLVGYRDKAGALSYDISVNAGFNRNKVTNLDGIATDALYDGYNYYNNGNEGYGITPNLPITITQSGLPFGSFYGYKVLGIFKTDADAAKQIVNNNVARAGDLIFSHDPKNGTALSSKDKQVIGNPNPKMVYGINIRLNWKGFDAALLFNGVAGVDIYNGVKAYEMFPFTSDANTTTKVWGNSFLGSNGLTGQPRMGFVKPDGSYGYDPNGNYTSVNSYFIESGSYLKLKNLQVGYTFSNDVLAKAGLKSARIFVMANNLFTITKYSGVDPEIGSSFSHQAVMGFVGTSVGVTTRGLDAVSQYPQTRIFSAGLDLNF